jgi:hypothetical protein
MSGLVSAVGATLTAPGERGARVSGGETPASTDTGDFVGIGGSLGHLHVPAGYISGTPLSDSATFDDQTLSSLGVTPGTYTYTWGSGPTADSLTLVAGVPEPSGLMLLALPLGLVMLLAARPRRAARRGYRST